ncbi:MAG: site-specific DNA-methyltransferase [Syntrophomonadaceae bacterium]|nr:site-specific DNA-methyltransferase [Syntrophomonadaceae bacterium]
MIEYFNEDCMAGMARYSDKYFDLAIVDPPYGIGIDGQKESINKNPKYSRKHHEKKNWDSSIPDAEYFRELERVSVNQIVWGGNYFVEHLHKGTKGWIVWDKGQHGLTMSDCELAYSSFDCPTRVVVINRVELLKDGTIHPTQKPIKLYKWLLTNYAKQGDKILDTHVGSASSLIACYDLGFDAVGFEIDEEYYRISRERLENHMKQLRFSDMWEDEKC